MSPLLASEFSAITDKFAAGELPVSTRALALPPFCARTLARACFACCLFCEELCHILLGFNSSIHEHIRERSDARGYTRFQILFLL